MKNFFSKIHVFLKPFLDKFDNGFRRTWKRYQLTRWIILILASFFLILSSYFTFKAKTSHVENLKSQLQATTDVIDSEGNDAGTLYSKKGTFIDLNSISPNLQNAVTSTEDQTFWTNKGYSITGYARAIAGLVLHGGITSGGSTITQQLAKNALLSQKQTFMRKGAEFFMAVQINKTYSKKDILTMYLNNAYFGNGVWGVEDASMKYFGVHANQLSYSQSAAIAAMLKSPSYYNPIDNPKNSIARRNLVLNLMASNKKITQNEADKAKKENLNLEDKYKGSGGYKYPYFYDAVIEEAINKYGLKEEDVLNKGYKIYTTLNQNYQKQMQNTFDKSWLFPKGAQDGVDPQAASIAINPLTGGVNAVVGGRGSHVFRGINRATQIKRQPGSAIKPIAVYTPAIENGYRYDSMIPNEVASYGKNHYTPKNADNIYTPTIPMYKALENSENVPAVALLSKIGVNKGVASVENFGINVDKDDQNLALALGGLKTGVSPLQMAQAYTAFSNDGKLATAHFITKIVDSKGNTIAENKQTNKQIISKNTSKTMTSMMLGVFNKGTGKTAKPQGYEVAGKTGSTEISNDYGYGTKDQWVVGYTPDIVMATWLGYDSTDKEHFLPGVSENDLGPVFKDEMKNILPYTGETEFEEKDADSMYKNDISDKTDDLKNNIQNSLNSVKDSATQWYNSLKHYFN